MGLVNPTLPTPGDQRGGEELDLLSAFQTLLAEFNGNVDAANIANGSITQAKRAASPGNGGAYSGVALGPGVIGSFSLATTGRPLLVALYARGTSGATADFVARRATVAITPTAAVSVSSSGPTLNVMQCFSTVVFGVAAGTATFDLFSSGSFLNGICGFSVVEL